jgi:hypothetical protein
MDKSAADSPSNPVQLEISSIYPAFIVLRLLRVGRLHGEKSDEVATQIAPKVRATIEGSPLRPVLPAALGQLWLLNDLIGMTCCAHETAWRDLGNPERDGGSRGLLGEFLSMKGVER